jgi:hypothetical protein
VDGGAPQALPQLQKGDGPLDFTDHDTAVFVRRAGANDSIEIWRVELAGGKRTLIRTINLPGVPAIATGLAVIISRDGKNYAYQYHPAISTEFLVEGLR